VVRLLTVSLSSIRLLTMGKANVVATDPMVVTVVVVSSVDIISIDSMIATSVSSNVAFGIAEIGITSVEGIVELTRVVTDSAVVNDSIEVAIDSVGVEPRDNGSSVIRKDSPEVTIS